MTGSNDKVVKLWQTVRKSFVMSFTGHTNWIQCVRFSPDNYVIASCGDDRTLKIWDPKSGQNVVNFPHIKG